ncbi:MAG: LPS-assembly protein LptD [Ignavibacterium sp.]|nr:LPS-assembly protein LptD [Ignavibacterium sp.]
MKLNLLISFFSFTILITAQIIDTAVISPDTLDLLQPDSLIQTTPKQYDIDTTVFSSASDSIIFLVRDKKMKIYGSGELSYKETEIKSANIIIDFERNEIEATGITIDTLPGQLAGAPVLKEGPDTYEGVSMRYNFKTGRGIISAAGTEQDGQKYTGSKIKKVDQETYFIQDGVFTTCDDECPHFHFYASKMKVIHKEQLVAEWIWLHFGGVPFPIPLPFGVFPIESGRRSGLIAPAFGQSGLYGPYFSRFGYFWAISDYMDLNATGDYYTRGSWAADSRLRYVKRYEYSGTFSGRYEQLRRGEITDQNFSENTRWELNWTHNQNLTPTMRMDANLRFASGRNLLNQVDLNEILTNEINSSATLNKTWEESGISLTLGYSRRQTFETNDIFEVLPNLSVSKSQFYPFKSNKVGGEQSWYELLGFSYNSQFQNQRTKREGELKSRAGIQHNISTGVSPKIGHFSISPNISYQERWYNKRIERFSVEGSQGQDSVITNDKNEINFLRTFNARLSASTKFYGMFQPNALGVAAIRHTVNPSISYNFTPDFSKPFWGYFDSYKNVNGEEVLYSKFEREIFGGASQGQQQSISFSVSNLFEMKTIVDPTDTTSKADKIQLLNLNASTSYNFAADSLNLSDLNVNYRTQIGTFLNFSGGSNFTFYDVTPTGRKINKFLIDQGKGFLRMTNFNVSLSASISGDRLSSSGQTPQTDAYPEDGILGQTFQNGYQGIYGGREMDPDFSIPWSLSLNYNFNENRLTPNNISKSSNVSGNLDFNLTPLWKFSVAGSYDLVRKEFSAPQIRISRDLHCWIMNFTWNPIGFVRGYYLEIRVKAPQLQDLKVTKRDQFYEGR